MKKTTSIALLLLALGVGACDDLTIPNYNDPSVENLTSNPTPATLAAAVQGLLDGQRDLTTARVTRLGVWGREGYDLRPEEPRPTTDALIDPIDPINGGLYWNNEYTQIKNVNVILDAVEAVAGLTEAEKEAVRGFAKTMKASAYWQVLITHPGLGIPLDPNPDPTAELTPITPEAEAYDYVFRLYDEAAGHLQNAGDAFPFGLTAGLVLFNTPSEFVKVNRALKARALKYQGRWDDVMAALDESFVNAAAPLDLGAYHTYTTNAGDAANPFFTNTTHYAHPRIRNNAQLQPDGTIDQRALDKTHPIPAFTLLEITVTEDMDVYKSLTAPVPWITNRELLLIRAEANLALGNRAAAIQDVNVVRTEDGGLAPLPADFSGDLLGEILYNKLYSLLWEGGYQYLDMRQYDKLDELPRARPNHKVYPGFPYPRNECLARNLENAPQCATIFGF